MPQITGSVLGGLAAAVIILGGRVPIGIAAKIAAVGLTGGPFEKDAVNEAIKALNNRVNRSGGAGTGGGTRAGALSGVTHNPQ